MSILKFFAHLLIPFDLGQGALRHKTRAKIMAFNAVPDAQHNARALDLGCGDGYWSEKLKARGYVVTAIDQFREYPNVDSDYEYSEMIPINANKPLPFADNYFDLIWCSEVIEHLVNLHITIDEIQRILKPGGQVIITTPNSFFWLHYFFKFFGLTNADWQNEGHVNFFHINDIKKIFPQAVIYGYFPYSIIKFRIKHFIGLLSPSFVIIGGKNFIDAMRQEGPCR